MATLTLQQIEQDALAAGWPAAQVPTIAAIVMAESGGRTDALNAPEQGIGLAQITPGSAADYDPVQNLRDALAKYRMLGWGAWTTYTGGQFQQFLAGAQAAFASLPGAALGGVAQAGGATVTGAITGAGHGLADAGSATISNIATWAKNQIVPLVVALAVALVLFGGSKR